MDSFVQLYLCTICWSPDLGESVKGQVKSLLSGWSSGKQSLHTQQRSSLNGILGGGKSQQVWDEGSEEHPEELLMWLTSALPGR